jgi:hypothetical protein
MRRLVAVARWLPARGAMVLTVNGADGWYELPQVRSKRPRGLTDSERTLVADLAQAVAPVGSEIRAIQLEGKQ